jgi:hypothetical protein
MSRNIDGLPRHFPAGTKYILESHGSVVHRYVEFPDGRKISLPSRKAVPCSQSARHGYAGRSKRTKVAA